MKFKSIKSNRLKTKEIAEAREVLLKQQNYLCPICGIDLRTLPPKFRHVDHSHVTGMIRAVLCCNCNSLSGKVWNCGRRAKREGSVIGWIRKVAEYLEYHNNNPSGVFHPTHLSLEEKRIKRNKRARKRRQRAKGTVH